MKKKMEKLISKNNQNGVSIYLMLVLYFVLGIMFVICLLILNIYFSSLEIKISNLDMSNIKKRLNNEKLLIRISLKIGKITWFKVKIDKERLASLYGKIKKNEYENKAKVERIKNKAKKEMFIILKNKRVREALRGIKVEVNKFEADISIGTENYVLTSYLVALITIVISNLLPHAIFKEDSNITQIINYKVMPIYQSRNIYSIKLNFEVETKISYQVKILHLLIIQINKQKRKAKSYGAEQERRIEAV